MRSRFAPAPATSGLLDIGRMTRTITTGFREPGSWRRSLVYCGRPAIGDFPKAYTCGTVVTGDHTSAFTAELIMVTATRARVSGAASGAAENLSTIAR